MEQALARGLEGVYTLIAGDLNAHMVQLGEQQEEDMETSIAKYGLVDKSLQFIPRRRYRGDGVWS